MYDQVLYLLERNLGWMTWNIFLALIPLVFSLMLFGKPRSPWLRFGIVAITATVAFPFLPRILGMGDMLLQRIPLRYAIVALLPILAATGLDRLCCAARSRSVFWWLGFAVFMAFLPNAPYLLTDIIHFFNDIRNTQSIWVLTLFAVPLYISVMTVGFGAYVLSLMSLGDYLKRQGARVMVLPVELFVHLLSAIGICLGRFERFNSWDLLTRLGDVLRQVLRYLTDPRDLVIIGISFVIVTGLYGLAKFVLASVAIARQVRVTE